MRYLCLVYVDEVRRDGLSADERDTLLAEAVEFDLGIRQSGRAIESDSLQSVRCASIVRVWRGQITVADRPSPQPSEQVSGFALLDAKDLNEAIRLAASIPSARLGCVEIRPVRDSTASFEGCSLNS